MHSAICKGVLKVGFWEAQKGLKRRRKKLHSATGEAQFREDLIVVINAYGLYLGCLRAPIKHRIGSADPNIAPGATVSSRMAQSR